MKSQCSQKQIKSQMGLMSIKRMGDLNFNIFLAFVLLHPLHRGMRKKDRGCADSGKGLKSTPSYWSSDGKPFNCTQDPVRYLLCGEGA